MGCHYYIPGGKYPPCNSERVVAWLDVRYPRMWAVDMIEIVDTELTCEFCALAAHKGKVISVHRDEMNWSKRVYLWTNSQGLM